MICFTGKPQVRIHSTDTPHFISFSPTPKLASPGRPTCKTPKTMSSYNILQHCFRKDSFRFLAIASLAFASVTLLPGCGEKKTDDDDDEELEDLTASNRRQLAKRRIGAAKTQLGLIEEALDQYNIDVGTYPSDLQGLIQNIDESERWHGPYFKKAAIPKDPWGRDYLYVCPGEHNPNTYDIWSYCKDNQEGGEGENADIVNWATEEETYSY